ncbi:MAG: nucleotide sugar dehydrogenase [Candidatus Aquilonibacter sp.]
MIVSVLGLGYIGLPTAALLADAGHTVFGFDTDADHCSRLARGEVKSGEQVVVDVVRRAVASGRLQISELLFPAQAYILCVPTPTINNRPDLRFVADAAARVAAVAEPGASIILESTVPPNTTERIIESALISAGKNPRDFHIAHCPERVIPGATIREMRENPRVIGGRTPEDSAIIKELYASFCIGEIHLTELAVAEFVKVVENTYRDVNIAFANELAMLAEELGIDAWESIALANRHPRVDILKPGPGVGGHCIPVDPQFLSNANPFVTELIQAARRVNERMPHFVSRRIAELIPPPALGRKVALLGAAYKADVDDARESPCEHVDACLRERGFTTAIYDPHVRKFSRPLVPTLEDALTGADAAVLLTDHRAFSEIDPAAIGMLMRSRVLLDTRHHLNEEAWRAAGFDFYVLGKQRVAQVVEAVA